MMLMYKVCCSGTTVGGVGVEEMPLVLQHLMMMNLWVIVCGWQRTARMVKKWRCLTHFELIARMEMRMMMIRGKIMKIAINDLNSWRKMKMNMENDLDDDVVVVVGNVVLWS